MPSAQKSEKLVAKPIGMLLGKIREACATNRTGCWEKNKVELVDKVGGDINQRDYQGNLPTSKPPTSLTEPPMNQDLKREHESFLQSLLQALHRPTIWGTRLVCFTYMFLVYNIYYVQEDYVCT